MKEAAFKTTVAGNTVFNADKVAFGLEKSLPPVFHEIFDFLEKTS